jgi:hypothetical protein
MPRPEDQHYGLDVKAIRSPAFCCSTAQLLGLGTRDFFNGLLAANL